MYTVEEYIKVESLEEAYQLKQEGKRNVLIGGNLWLKMGNKNYGKGIDLSGLGLDTIEENEDEFVIGCMCTLRTLELSEALNRYFQGAFKEATRHIVGVQFRNCATVGGSLFPRFGFSDILTLFAALDAKVCLYKAGEVDISDFITGSPDGDILTHVKIRKTGRKIKYISHRMTETDFPLVTLALSCIGDEYTAVFGARPQKASAVKKNMTDDKNLFMEDVISEVHFGSNMRGSGEYRKAVAKVLLGRALKEIQGGWNR